MASLSLSNTEIRSERWTQWMDTWRNNKKEKNTKHPNKKDKKNGRRKGKRNGQKMMVKHDYDYHEQDCSEHDGDKKACDKCPSCHYHESTAICEGEHACSAHHGKKECRETPGCDWHKRDGETKGFCEGEHQHAE